MRWHGLPLHEPPVWSPGFSRSGPPEGGTPYRWHDPDGFMVPMRGRRAEGALHEPTHPRPLQGGEQSFVPFLSVPLLGGVRGEFMVPRHGIKVVGAFQEQIIETYFRHHIKNCEELDRNLNAPRTRVKTIGRVLTPPPPDRGPSRSAAAYPV